MDNKTVVVLVSWFIRLWEIEKQTDDYSISQLRGYVQSAEAFIK